MPAAAGRGRRALKSAERFVDDDERSIVLHEGSARGGETVMTRRVRAGGEAMEAFVRLAGYAIVGGVIWLLMTKVSPWFLVLGAVLQIIVSIIDMRTNEFESPWFER